MFIKLCSAMIHGTPSVKPYTDVYQAGQCNDPMELRQSNHIQMFIKLGSAMIHGTLTVKPYTDVYQAGQCNDPMELRQSNPIQMFFKLGSPMIPWNSDSQTLYRCLSSWAVQ
jgi:hypothetical protein